MFDFTKQYQMRILVNGRVVDEYSHTDGCTYVEGRPGSSYELEFYNNSPERVEFVPSVDGLSIIDGKTAGLQSQGYLVGPFKSVRVPGWKRDNKEAAQFVFEDAKESYTNRMGNGSSNVGVIGVLVFREKPKSVYNPFHVKHAAVPHDRDSILRSIASRADTQNDWQIHTYGSGYAALGEPKIMNACDVMTSKSISVNSGVSMDSQPVTAAVESPLGTGYGSTVDFTTTTEQFTRRDVNYPDAMVALYYDSEKGLARRGIVLKRSTSVNPNPFPGYTPQGCPPPPGYKG